MDVSSFLEISETEALTYGPILTLPGGPSIDTHFDTFAVSDTAPSQRIETTNVTAYTFAVLEANANKEVKALECKIDFSVQVLQAELSNGIYNETILQQSTEYRHIQRNVPPRNIPYEVLEFAEIAGSNATQAGPIAIATSQPGCLGGLLNFEPREVLALTELGLTGIQYMVGNVTISAGRTIRTVCENGTHVAGTSWQEVTLVRITWWWLLLPIGVELLGMIFFVWVGLSSKSSQSAIWKSSLIAAVFHSLDSEELLTRNSEEVEGLYYMEQIAEKMVVRLSTDTSHHPSKLVSQ